MEEILQNKDAALIAMAICTLSMMAAAWGLAKMWSTLIEAVCRNPQARKDVSLFGFVGMGSIEAVALYMLLIAFMIMKVIK